MLHGPAILKDIFWKIYAYSLSLGRRRSGKWGVLLHVLGHGNLVVQRLILGRANVLVIIPRDLDVVHHRAKHVGPNGFEATYRPSQRPLAGLLRVQH